MPRCRTLAASWGHRLTTAAIKAYLADMNHAATPTPPATPGMLSLLRGERRRLSAALLLTVAGAAFELLPYWILYRAIDLVMAMATPVPGAELYRLAGAMAGALLGKYLCYSSAYYLSHRAAYQVLSSVRQQLVWRLSWAPLLWLQQHGSGELKQTVLQDVEQLESFIAHHSVEILAALVTPVFVALALFWTDWRLALAALATVPLAALASALPLRKLGGHFARHARSAATLNATLVEYLRNMPVMKAFNQDVGSFQHMRRQLADYYALIRTITHRTVPGWSLFTVLLSANAFLILPLGAWLHGRGQISLSGLLLAMMLGAGMLKPLFKLTSFSSDYQLVQASLARIGPLLAMAAPAPRPELPLQAPLQVDFKSVSFSYAGRKVLHDVALHLPAGSMTVLTGPSGAGKSTVARLLGGLIACDGGSILINGVPLDALPDAQRSGLIAVAAQDPFLFQGSVLDNLRLARPGASEAMVRQAAEVAQASAFIEALPDGYHSQLGERALRLSGGERQRLAVARALLADTPIVLLDEATAFADNLSEHRFYQALRLAYPHKTLLVIAHRMVAIAYAEQVVLMDGGRVCDAGTHAALLQRSALYQGMWRRHQACENWVLRGAGDATQRRSIHG
ncbi:ABC transporter ATP-binding protein [Janthinobacterium sp. NFX145]|uniref:ABC transporter ATP-binding protein n=1 Tax=Janthinobacterium sp. NFX145 TaxID=3415602 RepID=UPI003CC53E11